MTLDLDRASRDDLIDYICNLESELTAWRGDDFSRPIYNISGVFGTTMQESTLLYALRSGRVFSKESLLTIMYSDRADDAPELKIIDVYVCKIRAKIAAYGVEIATIWGVGYQLSGDNVVKLERIMETGKAPALTNVQVAKPVSKRVGQFGYRSVITQPIQCLLIIGEMAATEAGIISISAHDFAQKVQHRASLGNIARRLEKKGFLEVVFARKCGGGASVPWKVKITPAGKNQIAIWGKHEPEGVSQ